MPQPSETPKSPEELAGIARWEKKYWEWVELELTNWDPPEPEPDYSDVELSEADYSGY